MNALRVILLCACAVVLASCEHGLSPVPESAGKPQPGIAGHVTVVSTWPPKDSLFDLRVVIFRTYPPAGILQEFLAGKLRFSDPLPLNTGGFDYSLRADDLEGVFAYVVVAQQYGSNPFENWRVVGVYAPTGDLTKPGAVDLGTGKFVSGIDITVDFLHLPPQPF
jgi:hypothetical protein